jgi:hypothetical protein
MITPAVLEEHKQLSFGPLKEYFYEIVLDT